MIYCHITTIKVLQIFPKLSIIKCFDNLFVTGYSRIGISPFEAGAAYNRQWKYNRWSTWIVNKLQFQR